MFLPKESHRNNTIYSKAFSGEIKSLGEVSKIVFGIQTRKSSKDRNYIHRKRVNKYCKPALNGKHMGNYYIHPEELYVEYGKWLWNARDPKIFEAEEKLIIRQVGKYPICAYDSQQFYTLNTIYNIVIPVNSEVKTKYVLAVLNSKLIKYIWCILFPEQKEIFPRIKKEQLTDIPIKIVNDAAQERFISVANQIISIKKSNPSADTRPLEYEIDQMVYELYGLTPEEIAVVEGKPNTKEEA